MISNPSPFSGFATITADLYSFVPPNGPSAHPPSPVLTLRAACSALPEGGVGLAFTLEGQLQALRLPACETPQAWPLWQHTCFEAFLSAPDAQSYREYNFSPAGLWAAMAFRRYREMERKLTSPSPLIERLPSPLVGAGLENAALHLTARLPRALLPNSTLLRIGLSAVIERADGQREYWALHHPRAERADFHHPDGWTLRLNTLIERTQT
ncbi:MAG: DOMON-like domain-containing protein [Burkholderiaceae bacterium]|jgi:hypothetical protein|nr:DOMON-like domain-containing protein [Burkholderiaceae bacterium]